ncbi:MAG: undecaprenyl-diphosphate phosphatase [Vicinamibacterales bacterium]
MNYVHAALLGALQGLTEFLPVSSTAHLLVAGRLLGFDDPGGAFTIMIQLGSILAIVWLYRVRVARLVRALPHDPAARRFAAAIGAGLLPVLLLGAVGRGYVTSVLYGSALTIAMALILGGVVMLVVERRHLRTTVLTAEATPVSRALGVGVCQAMAVVPGISRSGATIIGGMLMGMDRTAAAEFSFFLAVPTMAAAFGNDLAHLEGGLASPRTAEIAVGFVAAFLASLAVVGPFLRFVSRAGFAPFAWYRIAGGGLMLLALWNGWALN